MRCVTSRRSRSDGCCAAIARRDPLGERIPARRGERGLHHRGGAAFDRLGYLLAARDGPVDARPPRVPAAGHLLLDGRGRALRRRRVARADLVRRLVRGGGVGGCRCAPRHASRGSRVLRRSARAPWRHALVDLVAARRRGAARLQDHMDRSPAALHARALSRTPGAAALPARRLLAPVAHPASALPRVDESAWRLSARPRHSRHLRGRGGPDSRTPWTAVGSHRDRVRRGHVPEPSAARARRSGARGLSQPAPLSDRVPSARCCDAGGRALRGVRAARDRKRAPPRRIASRGDALGASSVPRFHCPAPDAVLLFRGDRVPRRALGRARAESAGVRAAGTGAATGRPGARDRGARECARRTDASRRARVPRGRARHASSGQRHSPERVRLGRVPHLQPAGATRLH